MKRTVLAIALAVAALVLLASLVLQSRSIPVTMHVAHNGLLTELERIEEDHRALVATLESAWETSQLPGEGARSLTGRLAASAERIAQPFTQLRGTANQQNRLRTTFGNFTSAVVQAAVLSDELLEEQAEYLENVAYLRETGARVVQQMRDIRLDEVAADTFQLVVGTLDYSSPAGTTRPQDLRRLLSSLTTNQLVDANMPNEVDRLAEAVEHILRNRPLIEGKLDQIAATPVASTASSLRAAAVDTYSSTVSTADEARLMLSIYSVLLLLAAALAAYRLQASYRDINKANAALESLNQSLEDRVTERTQELADALRNLKESEVQLVQAEKMSSLGQLVAGISHEINTPLLYLANNAVLIQERLALMREFVSRAVAALSIKAESFGDRAEYQAKFVEELKTLKRMLRDDDVEANLEEAQDLTRDSIEGLAELTEMAQSLKDFSRLDRAPVGNFDVNAGLDKTLLIAKNAIKHKADVRKFYGELPEIQCSPSQINQVFLNIITNAAQAIQDRGEIVITTKVRDDDHVAITISDTGCGIPEEHLNKIRDPFFTTKEVGTGTGLGLSIVDEIIRSHHGELKVESQVGKGSAFTVILPIRQAGASSDDAAKAMLADLEKMDEAEHLAVAS